jgi:hypothetical protein
LGFTCNFIYSTCGAAGRFITAIGTFPADSILVGAIVRSWTKVCIAYAPKKFLLQIAKKLFLQVQVSTIDDSWAEPFKLKLIPEAANNLIYLHVVCAVVGILNNNKGVLLVNWAINQSKWFRSRVDLKDIM